MWGPPEPMLHPPLPPQRNQLWQNKLPTRSAEGPVHVWTQALNLDTRVHAQNRTRRLGSVWLAGESCGSCSQDGNVQTLPQRLNVCLCLEARRLPNRLPKPWVNTGLWSDRARRGQGRPAWGPCPAAAQRRGPGRPDLWGRVSVPAAQRHHQAFPGSWWRVWQEPPTHQPPVGGLAPGSPPTRYLRPWTRCRLEGAGGPTLKMSSMSLWLSRATGIPISSYWVLLPPGGTWGPRGGGAGTMGRLTKAHLG